MDSLDGQNLDQLDDEQDKKAPNISSDNNFRFCYHVANLPDKHLKLAEMIEINLTLNFCYLMKKQTLHSGHQINCDIKI